MKAALAILALAATTLAGCKQQAQHASPAETSAVATQSEGTHSASGEMMEASEKPLAFTAYGTDFRAVVENGKITIDGPGLTRKTTSVTEDRFAKGVDFTGEGVALTVRSGPCKDTAGHDTSMTATLEIGRKTYNGCAGEGAVPVADP